MAVYRTELLEATLEKLVNHLEHVHGAVIVSIEGFVVAAHTVQNSGNGYDEKATDSPQVAAMAATLLALSERTLERLAQGQLSLLLLEGEKGAMLVVPAGSRAAVALMVNKQAKMGLSLYALRRTADEIRQILEGEVSITDE